MIYTCKNCKWRSDDFTSVCVNGESEYCADFVCEDDNCDKWEKKMSKRERAIRGLEICLNTGNFDGCIEACPYFTKKLGLGVCSENMQRDALELLKAQEPRVMTLEEAKNSEFCFCESGSVFVCHIFVNPADDFVTIQRFGRPDLLIDSNEYGISFRCWTAHPTNKQREETKWE